MGPRPEGHGELPFVLPPPFPFIKLQWGHVQKDMESGTVPTVRVPSSMLQWGHVQKDMERWNGIISGGETEYASMGPRPEGHGERGPYPSRTDRV
mgnify:CR=1 FL=1